MGEWGAGARAQPGSDGPSLADAQRSAALQDANASLQDRLTTEQLLKLLDNGQADDHEGHGYGDE